MLILLSRVFVGDIDDFNTEWTEYYFDTDNPDGYILPVTVLNSSAFELGDDDLVWTNPENGDTYTYDGDNGVNKTPGDGTSVYDPPAPPVDLAAEYGERYRFEFLGGPTTDTYNVKIKIYEKAYEGEVEEVEGAADAASLEWENAGKLFQPFRGSRLRATLKTSVSRKYAHLFEGDEREYYATLDIDDVTKWTGWIHPDIYSEPYNNPPYLSSINFSDGLAGLKQIDMPDINANGYTGTVSEKDAIIHILKQVALGLEVNFAVNLREDGMDELSAPIEQSKVNMEAFLTYTNGETAPMDCYTALEKMLRSWNAVIFQQENKWWIVREPELFTSVEYKRFDKNGTAIGTASIADNHLTFAETGLKLHRATLETVPAFRNVAVSQEYGELLAPNGNFIKNGTCEQWVPVIVDGYTYGWNLKYWDAVDLTTFPSNSPSFLGSVRRVEETVSNGVKNNYVQIYALNSQPRSFSDPAGYLESSPIPVVPEVGNVIRAKLKLRCNFRDGDDNRLVEGYFNIAIKCGTQWLSVDTEGVYSWTGTETRIRWKVGEVLRWEDITIPPVPIPEAGDLLIRIYQMVQPGSVKKVIYVLDFDDIELGLADNPALANQRIYYVTANPGTFTSKPEKIEIQLGDVATVMSQNAKIIGDAPSSGWFRPGETPSQPLAALIAREWINQTHITRTRLRGGECHTVLSMLYTYEDTVNEAGKKFLQTGGIWSIKSGKWNPDLVELDQTETTIPMRQVTELRNDNQSQGAGGTDNTGTQNPPDPQTTAPEDGLEYRGTLVFNSAIEVEVTEGYDWMYIGVLKEGGTAILPVLGTPTTYNRRDALVGDSSGVYHWIAGTEDASGVVDPTIPSNRRLLEYVLRTPAGDNILEPLPEDDSKYVDKVSTGNQTILSDLTIQKLATDSENRLSVDSNGKIIIKTGGDYEGITLNGKVIGGVKRLIETGDSLVIPANWEYNVVVLNVDGEIINDGEINII